MDGPNSNSQSDKPINILIARWGKRGERQRDRQADAEKEREREIDRQELRQR